MHRLVSKPRDVSRTAFYELVHEPGTEQLVADAQREESRLTPVATNRTTFSIEFGVLGYSSLSRSLRNTKGTLLADARPVAAQRDDHQFVFHCFKLCRCVISALPKCKLLPDRVGEKENGQDSK